MKDVMTYEEVKRIRENPTAEDCDNKKLSKMIDIAIEKQIPKKPRKKEFMALGDGTEIIFACCPVCKQSVKFICKPKNNKTFTKTKNVFCSQCGQAIGWSEEDSFYCLI